MTHENNIITQDNNNLTIKNKNIFNGTDISEGKYRIKNILYQINTQDFFPKVDYTGMTANQVPKNKLISFTDE